MEVEVSAEAKDKRLNRVVALTVVLFSICMGLAQVKDGNIVQAMAQAQARAVDRWSEYQSTRIKLHIDEVALAQADAPAEAARLKAEVAKYRGESVQLRQMAQGFERDYDAYNVHDDQFDASDAAVGIAVAVAAVAALAESWPALFVSWGFGGFGLVMAAAGFLGWGLRSPLATLLS